MCLLAFVRCFWSGSSVEPLASLRHELVLSWLVGSALLVGLSSMGYLLLLHSLGGDSVASGDDDNGGGDDNSTNNGNDDDDRETRVPLSVPWLLILCGLVSLVYIEMVRSPPPMPPPLAMPPPPAMLPRRLAPVSPKTSPRRRRRRCRCRRRRCRPPHRLASHR